jgi:hypothetical protein
MMYPRFQQSDPIFQLTDLSFMVHRRMPYQVSVSLMVGKYVVFSE